MSLGVIIVTLIVTAVASLAKDRANQRAESTSS